VAEDPAAPVGVHPFHGVPGLAGEVAPAR
jgi:hypothetical protein